MSVKHLKTRRNAGQSLSVELAEHFKQSGALGLRPSASLTILNKSD